MRLDQYRNPAAGAIVRSFAGHNAFVPAKLPPRLEYDAELVLALSRADAALSELSGLGRHLPNPHLLISPYMRREAVLSSRIEGTRTSLSELLMAEVEAGPPAGEADRREVRNYVSALEYGLHRLQERPISLNLVRDMHRILLTGVRGDRGTPGEFRRDQNWIGSRFSTVDSADYVPPPPELLMDLLADWERFLHVTDAMPDLVQCAVLHEQFEAIHPFADGNGRLGRLLITLFLIERGRLSQPLLYLSSYLEEHRGAYYDTLQCVRTDGDWRSWLMFFLLGVAQVAREGVQQAGELMDLRETYRARLSEKARALALLDELFVNPYITVARASERLSVSKPTATQAIDVLRQNGMLQEVTGRSWRRIFIAAPILEALQGSTEKQTG
ncbi:MAG: Fic family protein [Thermomicrobiales bacterium]